MSESEKPDIEAKNRMIDHIKRSVASGSINFLFGAGVNGNCFPNMSSFEKTKEKLKKHGKPGMNIEDELTTLSELEQNDVLDEFISEYNEQKPDETSSSYCNLKNLLQTVNQIVEKTENRKPHMKKINIFTLNYDNIVEGILKQLGFFHHMIAANFGDERSTADVVGFNVTRNEFIPSFFISKLHGSANNDGSLRRNDVILPNREKKISSALSREFFTVLFKMKGELEMKNSVLFIIGYSGSDEDINSILKDAVGSGLTVYWLKYNDDDKGIEQLHIQGLITIPSENVDSTKVLNELLEDVLR